MLEYSALPALSFYLIKIQYHGQTRKERDEERKEMLQKQLLAVFCTKEDREEEMMREEHQINRTTRKYAG